jgi:hypothetical protein
VSVLVGINFPFQNKALKLYADGNYGDALSLRYLDFEDIECSVFPITTLTAEVDDWGQTKNMLLGNIYLVLAR